MLWELFGVGYERYADGTLRWNDCLNWTGYSLCGSRDNCFPSYANEIRTAEVGAGDGVRVLRMESGKLVVNKGIPDIYNQKPINC